MPWLLLAPHLRWRRRGRRGGKGFSHLLRAGPVNWSPRFHAVELDAAGYRTFMKYCEMNPVRAKLVKKAERWEWSSAAAHCAGDDMGGLLCLDVWRHVFGRPETIGEDWREYLMGPAASESDVAVVRMPVRREGPHNRPTGWARPAVAVSAGALPG